MTILLRCPICHELLSTRGSGAACVNNHQFDRARQGYLNLLASNKKRSKQPGDDQTMVAARTRFLNHGYYQAVVQALLDGLRSFDCAEQCILDAGCGEGFYTSAIKAQLTGSEVCGVDISKQAVVAASKRSKEVTWLVASVSELPIMAQQIDAIVSIFSRCHWPEFSRVLKPGGHIVTLTPTENHLMALRQVIYDQVRPYPKDKHLQDLPAGLRVLHSHTLSQAMLLDNNQAIMDLLTMTPHYWHINERQKAQLRQLEQLACALEMQVSVIHKKNRIKQ